MLEVDNGKGKADYTPIFYNKLLHNANEGFFTNRGLIMVLNISLNKWIGMLTLSNIRNLEKRYVYNQISYSLQELLHA